MHKINTLYALAWPLSVGVLNALAYGMPDPVGDALFLMAVLFTLQKRLWSYVFVATLMVLVREGYAVFSGFIALFSFFGGITWNYANKIITRLAVFIPVVIVSLWMGYVTVRFGKTPISAGKGANLTDWPLFGAVKSFLDALHFPTVHEAVFKFFGFFILLFAIIIVIKRLKEHLVWYAILAYFFLIATLGTTIWMDYSGYMKALGSVIIVLIISLVKFRSALCVLIFGSVLISIKG